MESGDQYGPALPPGMVVANDSASQSSEEKSSRKRGSAVVGPSLPPGMQKSTDSDDLSDEGQLTVKMESDMSPEYSIQDDQDDDDEAEGDGQESGTVGPMPSEMNQDGEDVVQAAEEFERRSKRMKDKLTVKVEAEEGPSKREEWMTELPPEMGKNFGLQGRTFSKGGQSDDSKDRSSWTETPGSKKEKESGKGKKRKRDEEKVVSARDEQLHQQVEDFNKSKRPESLMDMHSKKQKKKKAANNTAAAVTSTLADSTQAAATTTTTTATPANQKKEKKEKKKRKERGEKEEKEVRRPFDRDKDLQANRFDEAQRKSIIKKSQLLNSRFSHSGTSSHFL